MNKNNDHSKDQKSAARGVTKDSVLVDVDVGHSRVVEDRMIAVVVTDDLERFALKDLSAWSSHC